MISFTKAVLAERLGTEWEELELAKALTYLPNVYPGGPWLAGGAVRRTVDGTSLSSDFDFFFADKDQFEAFDSDMAKYRAAKNGMNTTYLVPKKKIEKETGDVWRPELKVQAIHFQYYDSLEAVLDSFDFTITQFGFDGSIIMASDFALWDLARKRLVLHKLTYATSTMRRLLKYTRQGYTACSGTLSNILEEVVAKPSIIEADVKYID